MTFEFKLEYDKQEFKIKKKQAAAAIINFAEANLPEQTISNSNSQLHASQLLEQVNACLENVERAVEFQQIIMQWWKCHNNECHNQNNFCYVDSWDDKHYSVDRVQHEIWVNAVAADNAIMDQSSDQMYNYLKFEQSSVDQEYQKSDHKEKKNRKKSLLD